MTDLNGSVKIVVTRELVTRVLNQYGVGVDKDPETIGILTYQSRILLTAAIITDLFDTPTSLMKLHGAYSSLLEDLRIDTTVCISYIKSLVDELLLAGIVSGMRGKYVKIPFRYKQDFHKEQYCLVIDEANMLKCSKLEGILRRKLEEHFKYEALMKIDLKNKLEINTSDLK